MSAVAEPTPVDQNLTPHGLVEMCEKLLMAIDDTHSKNWKPPEEFPDWQSYARDRDEAINALASGVVSVLKLVRARAREAAG